jgi:hypothetical protein
MRDEMKSARHEKRRTRNESLLVGLAGCTLLLATTLVEAQELKDGGPYVPTPQKVVEAMLDLAAVRSNDFVMDLGSGDGRIVLTAATRHRASGMGVDIDQELVDRANASAKKLGVADRVLFLKQDVNVADFKRATVLTLYLLPGMMSALRPKFLKDLRPGTRIVSHDFDLGEWKPDRTIEVETPEKYDLAGSWTSNVHLWIVPASVHGTWQGTLPGANGGRFQLEFNQAYQRVEGKVTRNGKSAALKDGQIDGARVRFSVAGVNGNERFEATVNGDRMAGEIRTDGATPAKWSASRAP